MLLNLVLWLWLLHTITGDQNHETAEESRYYAGRSKAEYEYVRDKLEEIERKFLVKIGKIENETSYEFDVLSKSYEHILHGTIGDELMTADDVDSFLGAVNGKTRQKRKIYNFGEHPSRKWKMPIKYMIDKITLRNVTSQNIIRRAIAAWEEETCVTFKEITDETAVKEKYIWFTNKMNGCFSFVGKTSHSIITEDHNVDLDGLYSHYYRQPIHLQDPGCFYWDGISIHEIGHALGLFHEEQRLDRNRYVNINYMVIEEGQEGNFIQPEDHTTIETKGIPYDLGSVMQYGPLDFSAFKDLMWPTSYPHEKEKINVMGQRTELGFYDGKIINMAYCPVHESDLNCENDGYPDPKNTTRCKCRAEWTGTLCDTLKQGSKGCNDGIITHTIEDIDKEFSLFSPNYKDNHHWQFTLGDQCFWIIKVPENHEIVWWISYEENNSGTSVYFGLHISGEGGCQSWVEIKKPGEVRGQRVCGVLNTTTSHETNPHYSLSQEIHISFRSIQSYNLPDAERDSKALSLLQELQRGFHLKYKFTRKGEIELSTTYRPPINHTTNWLDQYLKTHWYDRLLTTPRWYNYNRYKTVKTTPTTHIPTTTRKSYNYWYNRYRNYDMTTRYKTVKTTPTTHMPTTNRKSYNHWYNRYRNYDMTTSLSWQHGYSYGTSGSSQMSDTGVILVVVGAILVFFVMMAFLLAVTSKLIKRRKGNNTPERLTENEDSPCSSTTEPSGNVASQRPQALQRETVSEIGIEGHHSRIDHIRRQNMCQPKSSNQRNPQNNSQPLPPHVQQLIYSTVYALYGNGGRPTQNTNIANQRPQTLNTNTANQRPQSTQVMGQNNRWNGQHTQRMNSQDRANPIIIGPPPPYSSTQ